MHPECSPARPSPAPRALDPPEGTLLTHSFPPSQRRRHLGSADPRPTDCKHKGTGPPTAATLRRACLCPRDCPPANIKPDDTCAPKHPATKWCTWCTGWECGSTGAGSTSHVQPSPPDQHAVTSLITVAKGPGVGGLEAWRHEEDLWSQWLPLNERPGRACPWAGGHSSWPRTCRPLLAAGGQAPLLATSTKSTVPDAALTSAPQELEWEPGPPQAQHLRGRPLPSLSLTQV